MFDKITRFVAHQTGRPVTFLLSFAVVSVWGVSGPYFGWSDTWQLVINTGTTIVTFLMVFLIQSDANRNGAAIQAKLDWVISVIEQIPNSIIRMEDRSQEEIEACRPDQNPSSPADIDRLKNIEENAGALLSEVMATSGAKLQGGSSN